MYSSFYGTIIILFVIIFKRKKYYDLKNHYYKVIQKTEDMTQECSKYKNNIEKMKEKLNYLKGISPNTISTSTNSVASMDIRRQNNR